MFIQEIKFIYSPVFILTYDPISQPHLNILKALSKPIFTRTHIGVMAVIKHIIGKGRRTYVLVLQRLRAIMYLYLSL